MLRIDEVSQTYGPRLVLAGVSIAVKPGEVVALIGPNGAGKSTLLRAASGVLRPAAGRISVEGDDVHSLPPGRRARQLAVVPQAVNLPGAYTVSETVLLGRTAYCGWLGRESEADRAAAGRAMERTHTAHLAARRLCDLSGGERQLVLVARAVAQSARCLLLDEPTTHLDLKHEAAILSLVRELARAEGLAVLIALHDLNLAARYADRLALLASGGLKAVGSPDQVLTSARIEEAYGIPVEVFPHPRTGLPVVFASASGQ